MSFTIRKVLVSEKVDQACLNILQNAGIEVDMKPGLSSEQLKRELKDYNALVVRSATKVTEDVIAAGAGNLQVIGRAGTGVDNIDCNAATRHGIMVINAPGGNTMSAAELTCSMILAVSRNIAQGCASLKSGKWDRNTFMGQEVQNKTLAILGLGRIGREVASRMQSFGMTTIGYDPLVPAEASLEFGVESFTLEEIWPKADFITVHTPLIPQTKNLINDEIFGKCRKGVCIVNCARGGIIDEDALVRALESGQCGGAGLDVFLTEPPQNLALIQHPKVVCTPHLGASTKEAQIRVAEEIAEQIVLLVKGEPVWGAVNAPTIQAMLLPENKPWVKLSESLAKMAGVLVGKGPKLEVHLITKGRVLEGKSRLMMDAAAVGSLKSQGHKANLISAPTLSADFGIKVLQTHSKLDQIGINLNMIIREGKSVMLSGTVQGDWVLLEGIDTIPFQPPVRLTGRILVCRLSSDKDAVLQLIGSQLSDQNSKINSMSWSAIQEGKRWYILHLNEGASVKLADDWVLVDF